MATDALAQLLPVSFRDIHFPVTQMTMRIAHDLVKHAYWGVNGARVENTGIAPIEFSFEVPWVNTLFPGKSERWSQGNLYPAAMRNLVIAFARKDNGVLQHPEFGTVVVKAQTLDLRWTGERRGGCDGTLTFIETLTDSDALAVLNDKNPVQDIAVAAQNLDASTADLRELAPDLPEFEETFEDFARSITAVSDQISLLNNRVAGRIDGILYRANAFQESINRARDSRTWPATQAIERIKASAFDLRKKLLEIGRDVVIYRVPADTTLAGLTVALGDTNLSDVIKLNPGLMRSPVVPQGTAVRYYRSKIAA